MVAKKQRTRLKAKVTVNGVSKWVQGYTKRQLEQKKVEVRQRMITGYSTKDMSFRDLAVQWWNNIQKNTYRTVSTFTTYRVHMNKYILPQIDPMVMCRAVRRDHFQAILDSACNQGLPFKRVSEILRILRKLCLYGMETGLFNADYTANCTINIKSKLQQDEEDSDNLICLSQEQISNLLQYSIGTDLETPVRLMYYLGLRRGQVFGLKWSDVDFDENTISIRRQFNYDSKQLANTKSKKSVRTIIMPQELTDHLKGIRSIGNTPVCKLLSKSVYYKHWIKLMLRCGYARHIGGKPNRIDVGNYEYDFTPHALRHTYITILYEAGVDPVAASRLAGHSSYKVTADKYTAIRKYKQKSNADKIEDVFKSRQKVGSK